MNKTIKSIFTVIFATSLLSSGLLHAYEDPNVVIILVDDMGYSDAGSYNSNSQIPTPNIDSLAQQGMRFTDAHAPGALCHPSRYGLMTGQYPFRINYNVWATEPLIKEGQTTLASLLKSAGYRTNMVGKWHLGFKEDGYDKPLPGGPIDRGFDTFFGMRASTDIPPYFYIRGDQAVLPPTNSIDDNNSKGWSPIQGAFWREGGIAPNLKLPDVLPRFTNEAVSVIEQHAASNTKDPMMLYLAYPAPHTPWLPAPEFIGKSKASMYGDFVVMVDTMIGRVLTALDDAKMRDNTLVIFASDNGPIWYDVDSLRYSHDPRAGLRGMKGDAWEGGHRMPFITRWPNKIKANTTTDQTISFTDVMATLAAITETPLAKGDGPDSFNLLPVLTGQQSENRAIRGPMVIPAGRNVMSIRSGPWKLITTLGSGGFSKPKFVKPVPGGPTAQLYNMESDKAETINVFLKHPDVVKRLQAEFADIQSATQTRP